MEKGALVERCIALTCNKEAAFGVAGLREKDEVDQPGGKSGFGVDSREVEAMLRRRCAKDKLQQLAGGRRARRVLQAVDEGLVGGAGRDGSHAGGHVQAEQHKAAAHVKQPHVPAGAMRHKGVRGDEEIVHRGGGHGGCRQRRARAILLPEAQLRGAPAAVRHLRRHRRGGHRRRQQERKQKGENALPLVRGWYGAKTPRAAAAGCPQARAASWGGRSACSAC